MIEANITPDWQESGVSGAIIVQKIQSTVKRKIIKKTDSETSA